MVEGRYIPGHCLRGRILAFHLVVAEAIQRLDSSWPACWETLGLFYMFDCMQPPGTQHRLTVGDQRHEHVHLGFSG